MRRHFRRYAGEAQPRAAAPTRSFLIRTASLAACLALLTACSARPDPNTLVMIIESSPTNLDPRVGLDAYSERIDTLLFDDLLTRDEHLNVQPQLAESWDIPDPKTYIFHLHHGVRFHDGRPLTSRDVKWTFDSLLEGKIRSTKAAAYRWVDRIDAPDDFTVVFHLKEPFTPLLWNLSDGAIGVVPYGSGSEISGHPVGSGPFRFVSAEQDKEVVIERNDDYWGQKPKLQQVRFTVVPDTTTRALELRKGSADIAINALTGDLVLTLAKEPNLEVLHAHGTVLSYFAFNTRDPILKDARVRQAVAYAIDRQPIIHYLLRDFARPADSLLPPESWAYDPELTHYEHDPQRARQLLEQAGYPAVNGVRFHLTMKTSTEESTRLLAAVLQQQLREVGIALDIRTFESATFFADVTRGAYQVHSLRWAGGNEDPDMFEYVFHSHKFTPNGANRTFYSNPRLDALIDQARSELDQERRKRLYAEIQQILVVDQPYVELWYQDNVMVHSRRVRNVTLDPSGNYDFLKTVELEK
ncbi:MAG TPA: ABC transporter substrate-binding protein [Terriglobales bacterium]|jgi:peptide/nickel transport system substrate-binding protein|nr:ABC transporter substrate-binding protein [Terriglobales bacterium]